MAFSWEERDGVLRITLSGVVSNLDLHSMVTEMQEPGGTRRRFLTWFLSTSVGLFLIALLYPVSRYLMPPLVEESTARTVRLAVTPEEVKLNSGQIFKFGSRPGLLIRTSSGELRAFSAICTHLACIVQYRPDLGHIWCACHNGHFDLNGKNITGPPPRPLERYVIKVQQERIVVSLDA